jgi:hypothetical protein
MVVDLTSTYKYYKPIEWDKYGVEYVKIASKSDNLNENRIKFASVVKEFLSKDNGEIIDDIF